jgi:hypothetical protein
MINFVNMLSTFLCAQKCKGSMYLEMISNVIALEMDLAQAEMVIFL